MKTADQKAWIVAAEWGKKSGLCYPDGEHFESLCEQIALALKEQDRDTRHACAEATINAVDPHAACMNVRAV